MDLELLSVKNKKIVVSLVVGLAILIVTASAQALTWSIETVDSEGRVGEDTSLAFDTSGNPHISLLRF